MLPGGRAMTDNELAARNMAMLRQCHPVFSDRVGRILMAMEAMGYRPRIQEAYRSPQDEAAAKAAGHSEVVWSFHNATDDAGNPSALAVDLLDDDHPLQPPSAYLLRLAAVASRHLCETGILWGLSAPLRANLQAAIKAGQWTAVLPMGWDPTHVQPSDVTLQQAKRGLRPAA